MAAAEAAIKGYLAASDTIYQRADGTTTEVKPFVQPEALGEIAASVNELKSNGLRQRGNVAVVWVKPSTERASTPSAFVLQACLDSSAVELLDGKGTLVRSRAQPGQRNVLNLYEIVTTNGSATIASHRFPNDTTCSPG